MTDEDYSAEEVQWIRVRPQGGGLPFGIQLDDIEDMNLLPLDAEAEALYVEAAADIRRIKIRNPQMFTRPEKSARVEPDGDKAPIGDGDLSNVDKSVVLKPNVDKSVPAVPGLGEPSTSAPAPISGGLAALAKAIGGGVAPPEVIHPDKSIGASADARVLAVEYDQQGQRFRCFRDAVTISEEVKWVDWPVPGKIMTVLWCLRFMLNRAGTPTLWHQTFVALGKLNPNDHQVVFHDAMCRIIETAMCYDQINSPCLASMELVCRQIQCIEERYKDKFCGGDTAGTGSLEHHLMAGIQSRSQLCICPALNDWLADEIRKQTSVDKERRKAREERSLTKPEKTTGGK